MPLLTRDLPHGGRHVAPPPTAPVATASTRLRQLLPVGLLVAASSAGVAVMPAIGGSATADARHGEPAASSQQDAAAQAAGPQLVTPDANAVPTAYVLPRHGKHRATATTEQSAPPATGGRHRADAVATGRPTQTSTKSNGTTKTTTTKSPTTQTTQTTTTQTTTRTTATTPTTPTSAGTPAPTDAASPSAAPTSTSKPGLVSGLTGTVGGVVGVLGGTVGGLLGGS